jgi:predicted AlkP superfamily phosphohydrolase/phosphomutase
MKKIFILGLDCATPQLIFNKYLNHLPTVSGLIKDGKFGTLESTVPPVTVPAWMSMMTGLDPGQLGFYGFTDRKDYSYDPNISITYRAVKEKTLWDYLGDHELKSIVFNLPLTYPPKPLNGILISSFLTPDKELTFTYPNTIKNEIETIADGNYIIDVENFRTENKRGLLSELYDMAKKRFRVMKSFIRNKKWNLFIAVEMGIDRMHHAFWSYCFSDHPLFQDKNEFKNVMIEYYKFIDAELAELIKEFDYDTELIIVSDHGAKTLKGTFCINDWLMQKGYLKIKNKIDRKTLFEMDNVDWEKTIAWGGGGYYGKIFLNIKDREPNGIIKENKIKNTIEKIKKEISALLDPKGNNIPNEFFEPKKIYKEINGHPPDLIIYLGNLDWRVTSSLGNKSLFMEENTPIDNANHAKNGIYIHSMNPKSALEYNGEFRVDMKTIKQYSIYDVTPTILGKFNITIPNKMRGRIIN